MQVVVALANSLNFSLTEGDRAARTPIPGQRRLWSSGVIVPSTHKLSTHCMCRHLLRKFVLLCAILFFCVHVYQALLSSNFSHNLSDLHGDPRSKLCVYESPLLTEWDGGLGCPWALLFATRGGPLTVLRISSTFPLIKSFCSVPKFDC